MEERAVLRARGYTDEFEIVCCYCRDDPVVRVLIPPSSARPHSVDLLLCGHHYLASRAALAAANAVAIDETGSVLEPASTSVETGGPTYADAAAGR